MNTDSCGRKAKNSVAMLSHAEERELIERWQESGSRAAMSRICRAYAPLVASIARRYANGRADLDDLVQEGNLGLMEALRRFEPEKGFRLSTYARWWIESFIRDFGRRNRSVIRAPKVRSGPQIFPTVVSISMPFGDTGSELGDTLVDDRPSPETEATKRIDREIQFNQLSAAFTQLDRREAHIIRHRYIGNRRRTLSELGDELGISKERVRQIETRGFEKLKSAVQRQMAIPATLVAAA